MPSKIKWLICVEWANNSKTAFRFYAKEKIIWNISCLLISNGDIVYAPAAGELIDKILIMYPKRRHVFNIGVLNAK